MLIPFIINFDTNHILSVSLRDSIVIFHHFVSINYVTLNKLTLLLYLSTGSPTNILFEFS